MRKIEMVDLKTQFQEIKSEVMSGFERVCENASFINGLDVQEFSKNLSEYTGSQFVIPCANGTDAIQVALMALNLVPGDEIIVPAWTYVATAEVIALLGLKPIFIDCDETSFNLDIAQLKTVLTPNTKAIVPVHLFGQSCDMEPIMHFATKHNLFVIEDTAQAIGAEYTFSDGSKKQAGTIGHIGTTSFFPSKNLGGYGDGGAIFTQDEALFNRMKGICNHGELGVKYHHDIVGVNSRLDSLQAVVLNAKLKRLKTYEKKRNQLAAFYTNGLKDMAEITTPTISSNSTHVFHQYTLKINNGKRYELKEFLATKEIPAMIYYPIPLHRQAAYKHYFRGNEDLSRAENLSDLVISLPMHTEMDAEQMNYIVESVKEFFNA